MKLYTLRDYFIIYIILLLIIILIICLETYKHRKINTYFELFNNLSNNSIPLNIYQLWHSNTLPDKMKYYNDILKKQNPEFNIYIYNLDDARLFIFNHFDTKILHAFDRLKPIAYKSDLWRYCILYKYGGIYLDIKYYPVNNFKFLKLINKEYYCLDVPNSDHGIYNALIISKPNNLLLLESINSIVDNVNNNFYGENSLSPTGPLLLKKIFIKNKITHKFDLNHFSDDNYIKKILLNNKEILSSYPEYEKEKIKYGNLTDYLNLYIKKDIYYKNIIPLNLYQTWHNKDLPQNMQNCIQELQNINPEFKYHLFDDNDCRLFIEKYFSKKFLDSFDKLIPGAYKADLWRYCVLYINGGIYLDIKFYPVNNFKLINLTDKEYFCRDVALSQSGIYNAIMVSKPKNELLMIAINRIVENVDNNFYGISSLEPTGPILLKNIFNENNIMDVELSLNKLDNVYNIFLKDIPILSIYKEYRNEQKNTENNLHYNILWKNKNIYL